MLEAIRPLAWDSEFLGFLVGRMHGTQVARQELEQLLAVARQQGYRLLYYSVAPDDDESAASASALGLLLADRKATFVQDIDCEIDTLFPPAIEPVSTISTDVVALALQSGAFSRFRRDPSFAAGTYERLYTRWIEQSVAGERAREVLVYRQADAVCGLITLSPLTAASAPNSCVSIDLLAVDAKVRRQSIGTQLLVAARQRAQVWGYGRLHVVTQLDNEAACRFYEYEGFHLEQVEHVYHVWM
ncbi:GNAT family N-acetyltransferase [Hymenobacter sp. BT491]|uniref:GNAT family N-acetyltransferase n=1 Tax=Hymenobacter sp. BT491 TaxID=2766779 RepID=UPI001653CB49|nr:GNAT family N-acetyltransferase [Hymenobacter sp. BT491]MBC6990715.1 GNAT family N-acetyltransferase [Hymenobacter sp. BT491]